MMMMYDDDDNDDDDEGEGKKNNSNLNWRAAGDVEMMSDASFKAFEDFCSPSAGTIPRKANNESSTTVFARNAETYGGKLRNKHRHAKDCLWSWPPGMAAGQDSNWGGLWRLVYCHCCLHWLELFIHKVKVHGLYIKVLFEEIKIICLVQREKIFDGVKLTLSRKVSD